MNSKLLVIAMTFCFNGIFLAHSAQASNACLNILSGSSNIVRTTGKITRIVWDSMFYVEVKDGDKKVGLGVAPDMIEGYKGEYFDELLYIKEGRPVLLNWDTEKRIVKSVSLNNSPEGALAVVTRVVGDSMFYMQAEVGENKIGLAASYETLKNNQGKYFRELGLKENKLVWVSWDPRTNIVKSVELF